MDSWLVRIRIFEIDPVGFHRAREAGRMPLDNAGICFMFWE